MVPALLISLRMGYRGGDGSRSEESLDFVGHPLQDSALARLPPAPHVYYFRQLSRAYLSVFSAFGISHSFPAALVAVGMRTKYKCVG